MSGILWLQLLLAAGLVVTMYLFMSVKAELGRLERRYEAQQRRVDELAAGTTPEWERLKGQLQEIQAQAGLLVPPAPPPSGLNLTKRSRAMRLLRAGGEVEDVAADLQLPKSEVRLLRKVQQILAPARDGKGM